MSRTTRSGIAAGVSLATLLAGLASVTPAVAADTTAAKGENDGVDVQLVLPTADGRYWYVGERGPRGQDYVGAADSLTEAEGAATTFHSEYLGRSDGLAWFNLESDDGSCLQASGTAGGSAGTVSWGPCFSASLLFPNAAWAIDGDGQLRSRSGRWISGEVLSAPDFNLSALKWATVRPADNPAVGLPRSLQAVDVLTETPDWTTRSVALEGVAPEDADRVDVTYQDRAGDERVLSADVADGTWHATLANLRFETTSVRLTARKQGEPVGKAELFTRVFPPSVSSMVQFDDDVATPARVSGHAAPGATIRVAGCDCDGDDLRIETKADDEGAWEATLPAPGKGGHRSYVVTEEVDGERADAETLSVDWGTGVRFSTPSLPLEPGADLAVEGVAQPGTVVEITDENDPDTVLASTTTNAQGEWNTTVTGLRDQEYTLLASGLSKGANRTTAQIRINAGKPPVDPVDPAPVAPVVITTPTTNTYTPGATTTVAGTATPGATIDIRAQWNTTPIRTVTADDHGNWSYTRTYGPDATYQLTATQTRPDGTTSTSTTFELRPTN